MPYRTCLRCGSTFDTPGRLCPKCLREVDRREAGLYVMANAMRAAARAPKGSPLLAGISISCAALLLATAVYGLWTEFLGRPWIAFAISCASIGLGAFARVKLGGIYYARLDGFRQTIAALVPLLLAAWPYFLLWTNVPAPWHAGLLCWIAAVGIYLILVTLVTKEPRA